MAKKEEITQPEEQQILKEHINAFLEKAKEFDSEEEMLIGLGAIKIDPKQGRTVLYYDGLKGSTEPVTGLKYQNNTPYTLYQELLDAMRFRDNQIAYAKRKQDESYDKMAQEALSGLEDF